MDNLIRKLTSRKLWVSVAGFVGMMVTAAGGTENEAAQVTAIIMAGATVIGYVVGEGLTDAANKEIGDGMQIETIADIEDIEDEEE